MNLDYVSKIKFGLKRYKTIATDKATSRVLDGSYNSIYKGRSMNFDELREYVPGDDIKDIDWKATSRSQKVLIRQYIAEKRHNIMLIMDANRRMLAETKAGEEKGEVALIQGRAYVTPDDVKAMRHEVMRHRIMLNFAAIADGVKEETIIDAIVGAIVTP